MPDHKIGLVVVSNAERTGSAVAVVWADSGDVVAADGWFYFRAGELPQETPALSRELWEDWDDMPAKLLWRYNMPWVNSLDTYLLPHYSTAQAAAELIANWVHEPQHPDLRQSDLVAYFPVADYEACLGHLRHISDDAATMGLNYRQKNATIGLNLLS